jgi:hypothetical protein
MDNYLNATQVANRSQAVYTCLDALFNAVTLGATYVTADSTLAFCSFAGAAFGHPGMIAKEPGTSSEE